MAFRTPAERLARVSCLLWAAALLTLGAATPAPRAATYKVCVAREQLAACQQMAQQQDLRLGCAPARDRVECLELLARKEADVVVVDPEDMLIAADADAPYIVFKEIRTLEEPAEEFRYEAVAVVHKDLDLSGHGVQGLRGLRSCHTGIGRNVGYKIPVTKLSQLGVLELQAEEAPQLTAREAELRALSRLFSKACIVGAWSADGAVDARLKAQYSNLCGLCERPSVCDYPDRFSGYDGALRCLSDNHGQVAWTKTYYVKKHFGIPIGGALAVTNATAYDPAAYAYLCPDGSKRPVLDAPCPWAARPWQGYLAHADSASRVDDLRAQLSLAAQRGLEAGGAGGGAGGGGAGGGGAPWLQQVLGVTAGKTGAVDAPQPPLPPRQYLTKAKYLAVLQRLSDGTPVRLCASSQPALAKCAALAAAAFSRDVRPRFACVLREGPARRACAAAVAQGHADAVAVNAAEAAQATRDLALRPVLSELYGQQQGALFAVALVRRASLVRSWEDLRGKRSCHAAFGSAAGWRVPLGVLRGKGLLEEGRCPLGAALADFFSGGSCVPGALDAPDADAAPTGNATRRLCQRCAGGRDIGSAEGSCSGDAREAYFGDKGAVRCLAEDAGDVAFVTHTALTEALGAAWAQGLSSEDFELLCADGGRKPLADYATCHLAEVPGHVVLARANATQHQLDALRHALSAAGELFAQRPDVFRLFGPFEGRSDLLFQDSAVGFRAVDGPLPALESYQTIIEGSRAC